MIRPALLASLFWLTAVSAHAHITLPPGGAPAGAMYTATFRVGHACKDASATTGITVRLPSGFALQDAQERAGWTLSVRDGEVSWQALTADTALPNAEKTVFVLRGKLPDAPTTLWFKVLQTCDRGSADWADIPDANRPGKPAYPAARLDVLPAAATPTSAATPSAQP
jgi:uncharacterized protein YcnI